MFVLKYMGSVVNVQEPSTITITPTGVEVSPLESKVLKQMLSHGQVSQLDKVGNALEVAGLLRPSSNGSNTGRKPDPKSARQRVFAAVGKCLQGKVSVPRADVIAYVQKACQDLSMKQIVDNAVTFKCKRDYGKWSPIE
jgi:hypothetical protein